MSRAAQLLFLAVLVVISCGQSPQFGNYTSARTVLSFAPVGSSGLCRPSSAQRCTSSDGSSCGTAYVSPGCTTCATNFYAVGGECVSCTVSADPGILIAVQIIWLLFVTASAVFATDSFTNQLMFFIACVRVMWATSFDNTAGFPYAAQAILSWIGLFIGDSSFMHLDCFGRSAPFSILFAVNVSMMLGLFIPLCAMLFVLYRCAVAGPIRAAKYSASVTESKHTAFSDRTKRAVIVLVLFVFESVSVMAIKGMACFAPAYAPTSSVLLADPTQACFQGAHIAIFVASVIILLVLFIGTTVLLVVRDVRSRMNVYISPSLFGTATALHVADYKDVMFWWALVLLLPIDVLFAIVGVVLDGITGNGIKLAILFAALLAFMFFRPFLEIHKAVMFFLAVLVSMLTAMGGLLASAGVDPSSVAWVAAVLLWAFAIVCVFVVVWFGIVLRFVGQERAIRFPYFLRNSAPLADLGRVLWSESAFVYRLRGGDGVGMVSNKRGPFALPAPDETDLDMKYASKYAASDPSATPSRRRTAAGTTSVVLGSSAAMQRTPMRAPPPLPPLRSRTSTYPFTAGSGGGVLRATPARSLAQLRSSQTNEASMRAASVLRGVARRGRSGSDSDSGDEYSDVERVSNTVNLFRSASATPLSAYRSRSVIVRSPAAAPSGSGSVFGAASALRINPLVASASSGASSVARGPVIRPLPRVARSVTATVAPAGDDDSS